jgi:hypothetical protein
VRQVIGIYFMAAGNATENRTKTLDRAHSVNAVCDFLGPTERELLRTYFANDPRVYAWGANSNRYGQLRQVRSGEYVVDVANANVRQVFSFCFSIQRTDRQLQDFFGWDKERPYDHVYFLMTPLPTTRTRKVFFRNAFNFQNNANWLTGQIYLDDRAVNDAMHRTGSFTVEEFLGIPQDTRTVSIDGKPMPPRIPYYSIRETRPDQVVFRQRVSAKSGGTCALTHAPQEVCDAAHFPWADWHTDNEAHHGVLLRCDLHAALDAKLISIDRQSGRIIVSQYLADALPEYRALHGRQVTI